MAALVALLAGWCASIALPVGPLGHIALMIDPASAAFLALFLLTNATVWSASPPDVAGMARAAAVCLAMLAGDPFTLALGIAGATGRARGLLTGGVGAIPLGVYLLVRDVLGAGDGGAWWGAAVMFGGAAMTAGGGWFSTRAYSLEAIVRLATGGAAGLSVLAIGAAILARALDLGTVAAGALAAALLWAFAVTVMRAAMVVAVVTIAASAGTSVVFRLGGLLSRMPVLAYMTLFVAAILSALPPGPGFAAAWLLVQALVALCRSGGFAIPVAVAASALIAALGLGACAAALWRLVAVAMLGQPRTPRAAAAEASPLRVDRALMAFAAALAVVGLLPGLAIRAALPAIATALGAVTASGLAQRTGALGLSASDEMHGYAPLTLAALLIAGATAVWLVARGGPRGEAAAWTDGFASPPWLPFGEPSAQVSAAAIAIPTALASALRPASSESGRRYSKLDPLTLWMGLGEGYARVSIRRQAALVVGVASLALLAATFGLFR